jgi:pentatricopeptide repeat protein
MIFLRPRPEFQQVGAANGQRCLSTSQAYSSERASYNERSSSRSSFSGQRNRGRLGDQGSENRLRGQPYRNAPDTTFRHYPSKLARYNDELGNVISNSHLTPGLRICVEMREKGIKPDLTTYHFLLRGLAEHAMHAECLAVLEDMERMGVVPDQMAYHYIMQVRLPSSLYVFFN